ncbi:ANTAR domain-containing protein, partial [Bradyrhizobium sp. BRP56]|uniref:ANTAR domain-containing protein n=1 Tax=Bradyrhizobium sp. BRP56 TaxID=2793819 RepID=UPI001CD5AD58
IEKLDDNLRSMRTVERAKAILMATRQMPETEAYGFIRRQAMERRSATPAALPEAAAAAAGSAPLAEPAPAAAAPASIWSAAIIHWATPAPSRAVPRTAQVRPASVS